MKRKVYLLIFAIIAGFLLFPGAIWANNPTDVSADKNYIITLTPRVPLNAISSSQAQQPQTVTRTIQYFDGLGRPIQTIGYK